MPSVVVGSGDTGLSPGAGLYVYGVGTYGLDTSCEIAVYSVDSGHWFALVLAVTAGNCLKTGICCVEVEVVPLVVAGRLALAIVIIIDYTGPIG